MALKTLLSAIAIFGAVVDAIPAIAYPINSQFPPVARVSTPYSYTFPLSTFTSTSPISYTLSNAPKWLSIDSSLRTLFGTPSSDDVGSGLVAQVTFGVVASDASGSVMLNTTLVTSKNLPPTIKIPAQSQLASQGPFSAPSTLLYYPSSPFEIAFDPATFSNNGGATLKYYALTIDDTPLPSWVLFDDLTLTFSGQTPEYASLIQPPQTFGIQLIASDVSGYSGASIPFNIRVGVHLLAFSTGNLFVNATPGVEVNYTGLQNSLQLDGQPANSSSIRSVTAQTPAWLDFDNTTLSLTGAPPSDAISYNVSVQAVDIYGDIVSTIVFVRLATALFVGPIKDFNATIGSKFSFNVGAYIENAHDTTLTAQVSPPTDWIYFDSHGFIISGKVPTSAQPSNINITLTATSKTSKRSSEESFVLAIAASDGGTPTSSSSFPSGSSAKSDLNPPGRKRLSKGVVIAIVIPTAIVFLALLLCLLYYQRRSTSTLRSSGPSKEDISGPVKNPPSIERIYSTQKIAPLQLDTSGFSLDASSSVYTSTTPNITIHNHTRKSLRRSQTLGTKSKLRESQLSATRTRAYSENALSETSNQDTWRDTQGTGNTLDSSRTNSSNMLQRNYSNYSRKGHKRRSQYVMGDIGDPRGRNSDMSQLGTSPSSGTILNLTDSNFSSSPLDNFSVLSGEWNKTSRAPLAPRTKQPTQTPNHNTDKKRAHRKSTTRKLSFALGTGVAVDKRISGIGHGARESISSFDALQNLNPGNRGSIGHGQHPGLARNSRTWKTVNTLDTDADRDRDRDRDSGRDRNGDSGKHRSATSVYSTSSADVLKFGFANGNGNGNVASSVQGGKEVWSVKQVPKSPLGVSSSPAAASQARAPAPAPIWESETGGNSRLSYSSSITRPVSRRGGVSPFFSGGGMASVRRKARRSYADSPTVPEEIRIGDTLQVVGINANANANAGTGTNTGIHNESLGIAYPNGYSSAKEGTRQLRSYIQATFSKSRLKGSESMASVGGGSVDSRFESVSPSLQELQLRAREDENGNGNGHENGDQRSRAGLSQSRHTQLLEMDRREREMEREMEMEMERARETGGESRGGATVGTGTGTHPHPHPHRDTLETASDILPSEFSAGSWESMGESTDVDSQLNYIRHGRDSDIPDIPRVPSTTTTTTATMTANLNSNSNSGGWENIKTGRARSSTLGIPSFVAFMGNPWLQDEGGPEAGAGDGASLGMGMGGSALQFSPYASQRRSTEADLSPRRNNAGVDAGSSAGARVSQGAGGAGEREREREERKREEREREEREESPIIGTQGTSSTSVTHEIIVGPNARMVMGRGRRPISVDARENRRIGSSRAKVGRLDTGGVGARDGREGMVGGSGSGTRSGNVSSGKGGKGGMGSEVDFSAYI